MEMPGFRPFTAWSLGLTLVTACSSGPGRRPAAPGPSGATPMSFDPCPRDAPGAIPEVVRVASLDAAQPHVTSEIAPGDDIRELAPLRGNAFVVPVVVGTEHEGDGYYYGLSAVFIVDSAVVVVKNAAVWFHTIPAPGTSDREPPVSAEILAGPAGTHIGHLRFETAEGTLHHFVDLDRGKYRRAFIEPSGSSLRFTIDEDGPLASGCRLYWFY